MTHDLPVLGAAFDLEHLESQLDWVLERQRDVELQAFIDPEVLEGDWRPLARRTQALLSDHQGRLGLHGPFVGFTLDTGDPDVREVVRRRLDQTLDVAAEVGATHIVVHSPFRSWDSYNLDAIPGGLAYLTDKVHACLGPAVERAEALGCTFVIENIEDREPQARVALARSFASTAVAVSLDTGHANYAHYVTGAPPVDYHVFAAAEMLAHLHLQDSDGWADRHWPPGWGNVPWTALFTALRQVAGSPRLILELKDQRRVREAATWLERQGLAV